MQPEGLLYICIYLCAWYIYGVYTCGMYMYVGTHVCADTSAHV